MQYESDASEVNIITSSRCKERMHSTCSKWRLAKGCNGQDMIVSERCKQVLVRTPSLNPRMHSLHFEGRLAKGHKKWFGVKVRGVSVQTPRAHRFERGTHQVGSEGVSGVSVKHCKRRMRSQSFERE